jgi:endonuclease YncB( thermonuclease family)
VFWGLVTILVGASAAFTVGAERQRRELRVAEAELATGDLVSLERVVDGDSVVVKNAEGQTVPVRILGIKSFPPEPEGDEAARIGKDAIAALERMTQSQPVRVQLADKPKDSHGRTLATLYVGGEDLGMDLVRRGVALVYTVYPFPAMSTYLQEQHGARAERRGMWGNPQLSQRAELLTKEWERSEK